ncbi:Putative peptidoglycan binding domain-containing protein [Saccharopolyspora kobensis]|uniref:Peptidoglycan binding domain-containing protein n=1 Tax=Saccharopolyspora kobensis TaxID=146035 RepID=A0A1H6D3Z2_9PSEU|nr:peptidoglycan-binding protein [Saccharopolyspora kobensis]SEG80052.1 Putative peptidoglycan binding domain-containing protein [Saccharopolyspora kobensis]SFD10366.1 Putative peptidoglycan binding domain-containing protein [Saccharopolyspora kobensis]
MCDSCAPSTEMISAEEVGGLSRRTLFAGLGLGLAIPAIGLVAGAPTASAASLMDGRWANPALGHFPQGGHFGASRPGGPHAGQDVTNSTGTGVYAAADGTVIRRAWGGGLPGRSGNGLVISHGHDQYTYYGHLNAYHVPLNAEVKSGQRIADMGATGNVTGPHLHFEVHSGGIGRITDPVAFMAKRGVDLGGGWPRIDPGSAGATVVALQHLMRKHGHDLAVDGKYSSAAVAAVKRFQSSKGLAADGQVGPATWPKLVFTLHEGSKGDHVKGLQAALNKRSAGLAVDGDFGPVMAKAVRTYQSTNRLVVDGEAGPITWRALLG